MMFRNSQKDLTMLIIVVAGIVVVLLMLIALNNAWHILIEVLIFVDFKNVVQ